MTRTAVEARLTGKEKLTASDAYVYVIHDGDEYCKIGYSLDPKRRASILGAASPHGVSLVFQHAVPVDQARRVERAAHKLMDPFRVSGEWFRSSISLASTAVFEAAKGTDGGDMFFKLGTMAKMAGTDDIDPIAIGDLATEIDAKWPGVMDQIDSFWSWWAFKSPKDREKAVSQQRRIQARSGTRRAA